MRDHEIVDLYWKRSEAAITETSAKYGSYCHTIPLDKFKYKPISFDMKRLAI